METQSKYYLRLKLSLTYNVICQQFKAKETNYKIAFACLLLWYLCMFQEKIRGNIYNSLKISLYVYKNLK